MTIEAARAALADGRWDEARACFEALLAHGEDGELLEGLGIAARWRHDEPVAMRAHERAYRLYRREGDRRGAARMAIMLAVHAYNFRSDIAVGRGWVERARRILAELTEPSPEAGWLALLDAHLALLIDHDLDATRHRADAAVAIGRAVGDIDVEMFGLAQQGLVLVSEGRVTDGMRLLDEAGAAASAGDLGDVDAIQTICCYLIYACKWVRDFDRAASWCAEVRRNSERWSDRLTFSICRAHYADVLLWRGDWVACEAELDSAVAEFTVLNERRVTDALARLGELRRRQGRLDEADRLLRSAESHPVAILGRSALAIAAGDVAAGAEIAERYLRRLDPGERTERIPGLELLTRARAAGGDAAGAGAARDELHAIASAVGTVPVRAAAALADGLVAEAYGEREPARRHFEDAVDLYERSGAPFEAAGARRDLGRTLRALGHDDRADAEDAAADSALARLAATGSVDGTTTPGPPHDTAGLTSREREVLALVARGRSNVEIAAELVLSIRTVERHLSNIYDKIGAAGRAARGAAAAYAVSVGIGHPQADT